MSKRNTVKSINAEYLTSCLSANGWSNAYFCVHLMGKGRGWITEWKRGKNLPSPEEAARMCLLLDTTPEEILTEPADIELVRSLIEEERENSAKKDPGLEAGELTEAQKEAWMLVKNWDDEKLEKFIAAAKAMLGE